MREKKYRAYSVRDKKIYQLDGFRKGEGQGYVILDTEDNGRKYPGEYGDGEFHVLDRIGLKDKNGQEIYEGHIVKSYHTNPVEVFYQESIAAYQPFAFHGYPIEGYEVIGDIYTTPELLNTSTS